MKLQALLLLAATTLLGCENDQSATIKFINDMSSKPDASVVRIEDAGPVLFAIDPKAGSDWTVGFSPPGGCEAMVVAFINSAKDSVFVQAYSFTSAPIANALIDQKKAGRDVEVILDKSDPTEKGGQLQNLLIGGVTVFVDSKHAIAHNKVVIVDHLRVETGSFNYTSPPSTTTPRTACSHRRSQHSPPRTSPTGERT